jgi:transcriptional regulator with XRE-family HTH domain
MGTREVARDRGTQRARRILDEIGGEIRAARRERSLSQTAVAVAARTSRSQVSRIERVEAPRASVMELARLLSVVGLELSARAYPAGPPIRDAAHRALLDRLREHSSPSIVWRFEVPVGGYADMRAWDARLEIGRTCLAVEAETRPRDVQALQRRMALKLRDSRGVTGMILLLADTRHNRALVQENGEAIKAQLPIDSDTMLAALASGRDPGGSGVVLL